MIYQYIWYQGLHLGSPPPPFQHLHTGTKIPAVWLQPQFCIASAPRPNLGRTTRHAKMPNWPIRPWISLYCKQPGAYAGGGGGGVLGGSTPPPPFFFVACQRSWWCMMYSPTPCPENWPKNFEANKKKVTEASPPPPPPIPPFKNPAYATADSTTWLICHMFPMYEMQAYFALKRW